MLGIVLGMEDKTNKSWPVFPSNVDSVVKTGRFFGGWGAEIVSDSSGQVREVKRAMTALPFQGMPDGVGNASQQR